MDGQRRGADSASFALAGEVFFAGAFLAGVFFDEERAAFVVLSVEEDFDCFEVFLGAMMCLLCEYCKMLVSMRHYRTIGRLCL